MEQREFIRSLFDLILFFRDAIIWIINSMNLMESWSLDRPKADYIGVDMDSSPSDVVMMMIIILKSSDEFSANRFYAHIQHHTSRRYKQSCGRLRHTLIIS